MDIIDDIYMVISSDSYTIDAERVDGVTVTFTGPTAGAAICQFLQRVLDDNMQYTITGPALGYTGTFTPDAAHPGHVLYNVHYTKRHRRPMERPSELALALACHNSDGTPLRF